MNVIGIALNELYRVFGILNNDKFDGSLTEPVITIQKTKGATLGHFTVDKTWKDKNDEKSDESSFYEINIDPRWFNSRTSAEIVETLLHEMCHYWNYEHGVQDCSRGGTYHNKRFKEAAEARGLIITHSERYGWSHTESGDALLDFVLEYGLTDILLNRNEYSGLQIGGTGTHSGTATPPTRKPSSTRKYICPKCGMSVRATRAVNIGCLDCNERMIPAAQ